MLIRIIKSNNSLPPRMFHNRVDIFNIALFQLFGKLIKIIFLKINLEIITAERNIIRTDKLFICFNCLQG